MAPGIGDLQGQGTAGQGKVQGPEAGESLHEEEIRQELTDFRPAKPLTARKETTGVFCGISQILELSSDMLDLVLDSHACSWNKRLLRGSCAFTGGEGWALHPERSGVAIPLSPN
jgi:hypothetical protein